jgi:uncharacterized protein (TIGR03437 family)
MLGGTEVLINDRPAPLFSVNPSRVLVQVPWEVQAAGGLAQVVVRRGEQRSRPVTIRMVASLPAIRTANGQGWGLAGQTSSNQLTLSVTGLGQTDPAAVSGQVADTDAPPRAPVRVYVGGLVAEAKTVLSKDRVGEFDLAVAIPPLTKPGDIISVASAGQPGNRGVFGRAGAEVQFLRLPEGAGAIRQLRMSDLRGNYVVANGLRGEDGCYPTWLFDFGREKASKVEPCLITAQAANPSPLQPLNENAAVAAFVGPAAGDVQTGLSAKVAIFQPANEAVMVSELPSPASVLAAAPDGSLVAAGAGGAYQIDTLTAEVQPSTIGVIGPGGGGGGAALNLLAIEPDLGDGLNKALSLPVGLGQQSFGLIVGDSTDKPTRAKLAILNQRAEVTETRDFPAGWAPLLAPEQQAGAGPGQGPGPGPGPGPIPGGPGGVNLQARLRLANTFDALTRTLFVLARKPDNSAHAMVAFSGASLDAKLIEFPAGWFAANCSPQIALFPLELSRRLALFGAPRPEDAALNPCAATGFLVIDIAAQSIRAIPLPGAGQVNTRLAAGDINDYLFASNSDVVNRAISDTLYVLDTVAESAFRLDLPAGVTGFAGILAVPQLSSLIAVATNRVAGDAGLVLFDLEAEQQRLLPVPEGFQTIQFVGVFTNTRKLVARGNKPNNEGSQYLIYDLTNGDLVMPPNPPGVTFVGALPAQAPGPGGQPGGPGQPAQQAAQFQAVSPKSNFIAAIGFDASRNPVGLLALRVP